MRLAIGFWIAGVLGIMAACFHTDYWVLFLIAGVVFCVEGAVRALESR